MNKKKLWLSGSNGFIGKSLLHHLQSNYDITCISHDTKFFQSLDHKNLYKLNFRKYSDIEKLISKIGMPNTFLHLGWADRVNSSSSVHLNENVIASKNLIDCFFEKNLEKFVFIGSYEEYGEKNRILSENTLPQGKITNYGEGKKIVADYGLKKAHNSSQTFVHVRLSHTYGARQKKSSLINYLYNSAINHKPVTLNSNNDLRDFIHVSEAVNGIKLLMEHNRSITVNLGRGEMYFLRDYIMKFWSHLGQNIDDINFENTFNTFPKIIGKLDLTLLYKLTKWIPSLSLEDGIKLTIKELDTVS